MSASTSRRRDFGALRRGVCRARLRRRQRHHPAQGGGLRGVDRRTGARRAPRRRQHALARGRRALGRQHGRRRASWPISTRASGAGWDKTVGYGPRDRAGGAARAVVAGLQEPDRRAHRRRRTARGARAGDSSATSAARRQGRLEARRVERPRARWSREARSHRQHHLARHDRPAAARPSISRPRRPARSSPTSSMCR